MTKYVRALTLLAIFSVVSACGDSVLDEPKLIDDDDVPVSSPEPAPINSPEPGPISSPEPAPTDSPEPTPVNSPEPTPISSPEPAPTDSPEPTPINSPEPEPVNSPEPEPTDSPEPEPTPTINENLVTVYSDCDFSGLAGSLSLGTYSAGQLTLEGFANNTISSIKVPEGYQVVLYNNQFRGNSTTISEDISCLSTENFDNQTSSLSVDINTDLVDLVAAKVEYDGFGCATCHGADGAGINPIPVASCSKTDCTDVTALALYLAETMPLGNVASCDISEQDIHTSCAAMTAAFIVNNFLTGEEPAPVTTVTTPLARLTNGEFVTSAITLLGIENNAAINAAKANLGAESNILGLANDASTQLLSQVAVSGYVNMIDTLVDTFFDGANAKSDLAESYGCEADGNVFNCGLAFATQVAEKAFRRPLSDDESDNIQALFDGVTESLRAEGLALYSVQAHKVRFRAAMQYVMLSPDFLLLVEQGDQADIDEGSQSLSSNEIANRMAYFLTGNLPDEGLLDAAQAGELFNAEIRLEHANRLLDSGLGRENIANILTSWMGVKQEGTDEESVQAFNDFIANWVNNDRPFNDLYQAPVSVQHLDGTLSDEPLGVLGLNAFVASHTEFPTPSFITRGVFLVERLLCEDLPDDVPADALESEGLSPIEVFERHAQEPCASCHRVFDNYGAAFQQFDAETSLFVPNNTDFGTRFDLYDIGDVSSEISDLSDLSLEMGFSSQAPACMTELWYRHALRRNIDSNEADRQVLESLIDEWEASGDMSIKSLLRAIVASDVFITLFL